MIEEVVRNTRLPIRLLYIDAGDPDWLRAKIAIVRKSGRSKSSA